MIQITKEDNNVIDLRIDNLDDYKKEVEKILENLFDTGKDLRFSKLAQISLGEELLLAMIVRDVIKESIMDKDDYKVFRIEGTDVMFYITTVPSPKEELSGINYGRIVT